MKFIINLKIKTIEINLNLKMKILIHNFFNAQSHFCRLTYNKQSVANVIGTHATFPSLHWFSSFIGVGVSAI